MVQVASVATSVATCISVVAVSALLLAVYLRDRRARIKANANGLCACGDPLLEEEDKCERCYVISQW